jgi:hypothetical protein
MGQCNFINGLVFAQYTKGVVNQTARPVMSGDGYLCRNITLNTVFSKLCRAFGDGGKIVPELRTMTNDMGAEPMYFQNGNS